MIYWAPLLHFYQPPTQLYWVLKKVCIESYRPLVSLLQSLPNAAVTVNINAVLTEMLDEHGMSDVIEGLRDLAEKGKVEFTGSAKYHAILPLVSEDEMLRQIMHNYHSNRRYFGTAYAPQGFFPPEMSYGRNIVDPVLETGHHWMIMSGIACPLAWPTDIVYRMQTNGQDLSIVFRDDILSNKISFKKIDSKGFLEHLRGLEQKGKDTYVVTAMDAETFGHHIQNWEKQFLAEVYSELGEEADSRDPWADETLVETLAQTGLAGNGLLKTAREAPNIRVVTISKLLEAIPRGGPVEPRPSSWSTSIEDIQAGNPYPLWKSKDNSIHQFQWQHLKLAFELTRRANELAANEQSQRYVDIARGLLDRAVHSDQFWWASRRPWWDVNLVNRGLLQQSEVIFNAFKAIKVSDAPEEDKAEAYYRVTAAHDLRAKVMDQLFTY